MDSGDQPSWGLFQRSQLCRHGHVLGGFNMTPAYNHPCHENYIKTLGPEEPPLRGLHGPTPSQTRSTTWALDGAAFSYNAIHVHTYIHTYIHTHIHTYIHTHTYCIHTYIHTYTYIQTHTYIHTLHYIHSHTDIFVFYTRITLLPILYCIAILIIISCNVFDSKLAKYPAFCGRT